MAIVARRGQAHITLELTQASEHLLGADVAGATERPYSVPSTPPIDHITSHDPRVAAVRIADLVAYFSACGWTQGALTDQEQVFEAPDALSGTEQIEIALPLQGTVTRAVRVTQALNLICALERREIGSVLADVLRASGALGYIQARETVRATLLDIGADRAGLVALRSLIDEALAADAERPALPETRLCGPNGANLAVRVRRLDDDVARTLNMGHGEQPSSR